MDVSEIVVGLGNPGQRYRATRHNIGFWVLNRLAIRHGVAFGSSGDLGQHARTATAVVAGRAVLLVKPQTFMNRSGTAVAALIREYGEIAEKPVLVYDDADLQLGRIRVRFGGGSGGHNGVRSVKETVGSAGEFPRVRLGVRGETREDQPLADYVLEPFSETEQRTAAELADVGADAVTSLIECGLQSTMSQFNGIQVGAERETED